MLQNLIDRTDSMFACLAHNFLTSVYFTRHEQCQAYNGNNFNIEGLPPDVKWVPKYTGSKFQNVTWLKHEHQNNFDSEKFYIL